MNVTTINLQDGLQTIFAAFERFQDLHLGLGTLMAIAALFVLALFFATREIFAWFFKINDLKTDVRRLRTATMELEGQVRSVQNVLQSFAEQMKSPAQTSAQLPPQEPPRNAETEKKPAKSVFPIVH